MGGRPFKAGLLSAATPWLNLHNFADPIRMVELLEKLTDTHFPFPYTECALKKDLLPCSVADDQK